MPDSKKATFKIDDVKEWAKTMGQRGVYKASTAQKKISALTNIASVLGDEESKDPKTILENLDQYADRWARKESATATVIGPMKSHAGGLLKDFFEYQDDPSSFRPGKRPSPTKKEKAGSRVEPAKQRIRDRAKRPESTNIGSPSIHLDIQIHITPDTSADQIDKIFESIARHLPTSKS